MTSGMISRLRTRRKKEWQDWPRQKA
jgi:hypothetical protein